jgi:phosphatidylserine/phosphatidylglycerophosphate/cardiolipin synthase-like enzyme
MSIFKDQGYFNLVKRLIDGAAKEILVSQFKIDSCGIVGKGLVNQLLVALTSKAEGGVKVNVLLDCLLPLKGRSANNVFVALWMKKRKVNVRYLVGNRCQHSKILEVDGEHVVIGSHNWTVNSLTRNSEMSVYLTDDETVRQVREAYEAEFAGATDYG